MKEVFVELFAIFKAWHKTMEFLLGVVVQDKLYRKDGRLYTPRTGEFLGPYMFDKYLNSPEFSTVDMLNHLLDRRILFVLDY